MMVGRWLTLAVLMTLLGSVLACGEAAAPTVPADAEPRIIEWTIGPQGGLGGPGAFITKHVWEPRELEAPVNYPFIIRFVPRPGSTDQDYKDTLVFGKRIKEATGADLPDLTVEGGEPVDSPVLLVKDYDGAFDIFSRSYRGTGGYGTLITPPEP